MDNTLFFIYLLILAGSTYLIRAVPFAAVRKNIQNKYLRSFLAYIPYAVLTAMTIPAILYATGSVWSALGGLIVAIILAYFGQGLTTVAIAACVTVYILELIII